MSLPTEGTDRDWSPSPSCYEATVLTVLIKTPGNSSNPNWETDGALPGLSELYSSHLGRVIRFKSMSVESQLV